MDNNDSSLTASHLDEEESTNSIATVEEQPVKSSKKNRAGSSRQRHPVVAKRHLKKARGGLEGISKPSVVRLARKAGIKRLSKSYVPEMKSLLLANLTEVIEEVMVLAMEEKKKTLQVRYLAYVFNKMDRRVYGFDTKKKSKRSYRKKPKTIAQDTTDSDAITTSD